MPAATLEDRMELGSREEDGGTISSTDAFPSYQIYSTDESGSLRVSSPPQEGKVLLAISAKKKGFAVQKMAKGTLANKKDVLALARRNGQIDVVTCREGKVLVTFRQADMRDGIHRWVGLAVAANAIYSCTSAGSFRYTPLNITASSVSVGTVIKISLPEPLQDVVFEPESDPKLFAYGGEEVPLSVWDARKAITQAPPDDSSQGSGEEEENGDGNGLVEDDEALQSAPSGSNRAGKRKRMAERRAKAKEFMWGELWRAKNLPNDALSLQRRAGILCVAFLEENKLAVGTKSGMLRLYEVGPQRKHKKEVRLFHPKVAPVKHLVRSHNAYELIASDTLGRVFVFNWRSASLLYKYLPFSGAVVSMCSMPPPRSQRQAYLATASAEKLFRLHAMPASSSLLQKSKENGKIVSTQFYEHGVTNLVYDGGVPEGSGASGEASDNGRGEEAAAEEQDDVWQTMAVVDEEAEEREPLGQRRRTG